MIFPALLIDIAPIDSGPGIIAAVAFFLVFAAVAYVAFRMLKRTVKMAVRMTIVALILLIAALGTIFIWYGSGSRGRPVRPPANRTR
jgi:hypothetical protein